jgi:hypothetical protein
MGDGRNSWPPRYVAVVVAAALHVVLVTTLIGGTRIRLRSPPSETVTTTLVSLPNAPATVTPSPAPELQLAPLMQLMPVVPQAPPITYPSADNMPSTVDWQAEAQKAAAAITDLKGVPAEPEDRRRSSSSQGPRPWFPPPAHHAGEQYKTITGDSIVWINDKCYVRSSAPLLGVPDIIARGMLSATFCPDSSGAAPGRSVRGASRIQEIPPGVGPAEVTDGRETGGAFSRRCRRHSLPKRSATVSGGSSTPRNRCRIDFWRTRYARRRSRPAGKRRVR